MDEATHFKFFKKRIDYNKSHPRGKKIYPINGRFLGHVITFLNFKLTSIFLVWMRLRCLNFASGLTTASPTPRVKNSAAR